MYTLNSNLADENSQVSHSSFGKSSDNSSTTGYDKNIEISRASTDKVKINLTDKNSTVYSDKHERRSQKKKNMES